MKKRHSAEQIVAKLREADVEWVSAINLPNSNKRSLAITPRSTLSFCDANTSCELASAGGHG